MVDPLFESLDRFAASLDRLKRRMDQGFDRMDKRFDQMDRAFQAFREHMDRRFDELQADRAADRQMFYDILGNNEGRIRDVERRNERPT